MLAIMMRCLMAPVRYDTPARCYLMPLFFDAAAAMPMTSPLDATIL